MLEHLPSRPSSQSVDINCQCLLESVGAALSVQHGSREARKGWQCGGHTASLCHAGGQDPGRCLLHLPLHITCQQGQQGEHHGYPGGNSLGATGGTLLATFLLPTPATPLVCHLHVIHLSCNNQSQLVQPRVSNASECLVVCLYCARCSTPSHSLRSVLICGPSCQWMNVPNVNCKRNVVIVGRTFIIACH
jgi:hypothetical protein